MYIIPLVGINKVCHGRDARVILIWFGLLRVKRIDVGFHQHGCQNEVLENLDTLQRSSFIVVLERLEEIDLGIFPIF